MNIKEAYEFLQNNKNSKIRHQFAESGYITLNSDDELIHVDDNQIYHILNMDELFQDGWNIYTLEEVEEPEPTFISISCFKFYKWMKLNNWEDCSDVKPDLWVNKYGVQLNSNQLFKKFLNESK